MGALSEFTKSVTSGWKSGWRAGGVRFFIPSTSLKISAFERHERRVLKETQELYHEVKASYEASPFGNADNANSISANDFILHIILEAFERSDRAVSVSLGTALFDATDKLIEYEGLLYGFPDVDWSRTWEFEERIALKEYLQKKRRFLNDREHLTEVWNEKVIRIYEGILGYFPETAFSKEDEDETELTFNTAFVHCIDEPAEVIERTIMTMFDDDVSHGGLFDDIRTRLNQNALIASGIDPRERDRKTRSITLPTGTRGKSPSELVDLYLANTPFADLFHYDLPFAIPSSVRYEHCHMIAGTGHGKTQTLQFIIKNDLERAREEPRSVVVIDSQGDLIRTISHLHFFSPHAEKSLADKLVIIDPNDIEYPVCLNMFDVNMERISHYAALEREKILNGTIELYEYIFGALLGAELTQKQGVVFRYLARLMLAIPNATLHTLRELMEDGTPFKPYMDRLEGTSRKFFETQFFNKSFDATKTQMLRRLWGVLSNRTFERMFSHKENKIDLFEAMNTGKIILINTAKDLLKTEGSQIFGRFFIAMIGQAALQRAAIPAEMRCPTFVFIDEAAEYFDPNDTYLETLLSQSRKYCVSISLCHQSLSQAPPHLRATFMANTSIKLAGGVSAGDARTLAPEMYCDTDFIQGVKKRRASTEFACWVKNVIPQAMKITVPLGIVERLPQISDDEYSELIATNRASYSSPAQEYTDTTAEQLSEPVAPLDGEEERGAPSREIDFREAEPTPGVEQEQVSKPKDRQRSVGRISLPPSPGVGGKEHRYLQQLVNQFALDRGFRTTVEKEVLDGGGRVDVSLELGEVDVACEISVTSTPEQELGNVQKCLRAGYTSVCVIASQRKRLKAIQSYVARHLEAEESERVSFLLPAEIEEHLDRIAANAQAQEDMERGYKVKVTYSAVEAGDAAARRKELAKIVGRSIQKLKGEKGEDR